MRMLDAVYRIRKDQSPVYKIVEELLAAGVQVPVYHAGKKIGYGVSCTVLDNGMGRSFGLSAPHPNEQRMKMKFNISINMAYDEKITAVDPEFTTYRNGQHEIELLKCFHITVGKHWA